MPLSCRKMATPSMATCDIKAPFCLSMMESANDETSTDLLSRSLLPKEDEQSSTRYNEEVCNDHLQFVKAFFASSGAPQILVLSLFLSFGISSTFGIIPDVMTDRYAFLHHGYIGPDCSTFDRVNKPDACQDGSDDAQESAALSALAKNLLALTFNSLIGSISDVRGRKWIMVISLFLSMLSPLMLLLMQLVPLMEPFWFYVIDCTTGAVNGMSISFAMLSDVMPPKWRAPAFGMYLAAYYIGFSFAPSLPLIMTHFQVSILSLLLLFIGFLFAICLLPETLPENVAEQNQAAREEQIERLGWRVMIRPIMEMSILNRDSFLRLLSAGSFLSGMVYSSDAVLVVYYVEDQLNVRDSDLAQMFFIMGLLGIVIQAILLKPMIAFFGDKGLLVISFLSGTCHNACYALARGKGMIYVAFCLAQLTKTNFPLLSSLAANNVNEHEQGRIQGALFALTAMADAIGPVTLEHIYRHTKATLGPGTMFVFASCCYFLGTIFVALLPIQKHQSRGTQDLEGERVTEDALAEPVLDPLS